jgi:hypothetical protein
MDINWVVLAVVVFISWRAVFQIWRRLKLFLHKIAQLKAGDLEKKLDAEDKG